MWGHSDVKEKTPRHLIAWNHMCKRLEYGGAGIHDIDQWNYAFAAIKITTDQENMWADQRQIQVLITGKQKARRPSSFSYTLTLVI